MIKKIVKNGNINIVKPKRFTKAKIKIKKARIV